MSSLEVLAERLQDAISDTVCMTGEQHHYGFTLMQPCKQPLPALYLCTLFTLHSGDVERSG